jgi:aerobic C4-dicarboxylate transport protein
VLILGVDSFMSEAKSITNLIGNCVASLVMAKSEKAFDQSKLEPAYASELSAETIQTGPFLCGHQYSNINF